MVPCGPQPVSFEEEKNRVNNSARRLEVLRTCITFIFENKIHDARKVRFSWFNVWLNEFKLTAQIRC